MGFLYDGQGRRLAKTVTRRDAPGSPVATFYVWDGWKVVEETESVRDAETVVAEYLPGLAAHLFRNAGNPVLSRRHKDTEE